jgi:hypothetical protein
MNLITYFPETIKTCLDYIEEKNKIKINDNNDNELDSIDNYEDEVEQSKDIKEDIGFDSISDNDSVSFEELQRMFS